MYDYQIETLFLVNQLNHLKEKVDEYETTIDYLNTINEQLSEHSKLANIIVSNSRDLLLRHAPDGEILFASPSSLNITGYLANELIGTNIFSLVYEKDVEDVESILQKYISSDKIHTIRFRLKHKYKGIVWVEAKRKVLHCSNCEIYREVINWISNIEVDVKREESLVSLLGRLNSKTKALGELCDHLSRTILKLKIKESDIMELSRLKNRMISIVAHDLKNPFSTLQNMTELVLDNDNPLSVDELHTLCEKVHYSVVKVNTLLDSLVTWSQNQSAKFTTKVVEICLKDLINECWRIYYPSTQRKQLKLKNAIDEQTVISTDKNILSTILRNIISNAVKYSEMNGEITMSYREDKSYKIIEIIDEGIGMSEDEVYNINNLLAVNSKPGTLEEMGSGLGLVIVSELLPKINGILFVSSKNNIGTSFEIKLSKTDARLNKINNLL